MLVIALSAAIAASSPAATLFTNGKVIPVTGPEIDDGHVFVENGRIVSVGEADAFAAPKAMEYDVIDLQGGVLMPGLICTHSHIGGWGGGDGTAPIQPETRILDAIDVQDPGFRRAVAGGLTTLNIMPGSGHLCSGQTVYVKLREADTIDDQVIRTASGGIAGGLKMANGTNPQRNPPFPGTRGKAAALVRQQFIAAQEYMDRIERAGDDMDKRPDRDLGLEIMAEVLRGERVVHHHTHRHDDIMTVLRLAKEFGFRVVLHHVSDGWKVADEIAAAGVPCSIIVVDSPGGKQEAIDIDFKTGRVLAEAGVSIAYHTDDWITDSRYFLRSPAMGIRAGLDRTTALRSVTINAAEMLDLGDRTGSIEIGKDADLVWLSGDPFSVYTTVHGTWVEGDRVFDRTDQEDLLFAQGGWGAGNAERPYMCCEEHQSGGNQ
ncbi:MAG: amidohydrolase family protein [Phycisphaerales bacterium]|nr:amidohydrolase family protein [Phycisphaerales bacterium]